MKVKVLVAELYWTREPGLEVDTATPAEVAEYVTRQEAEREFAMAGWV